MTDTIAPQKQYKFHRVDPEKGIDEWEDVAVEAWQWEVVYKDGTSLKQFDDNGVFHQIREIIEKDIHVFRMISTTYPHRYTIIMPEGAKFLHMYRRINSWNTGEKIAVFYIFGYKNKFLIGEEAKYFVITPGNELIITEDLQTISYQ